MIPEWSARQALWRLSSVKGSRCCSRFPIEAGSAVKLVESRTKPGRVSVFGVATCGRVWICPTCARRASGQRVARVASAVEKLRQGGPLALVTLTIPHHANEPLEAVRERLATMWRSMRTGRGAWKGTYVRALEVTHGKAGWHVHLHVVTHLAVARSLRDRWVDIVGGKSGLAHGKRAIVMIEPGAAVSYIAREVVYSGSKHRSQWGLLRRVIKGDAPLRLWHEWEAGSRGMRQLTASRSLGLKVDDETPVEDRAEEDDLLLAVVRARAWPIIALQPHRGELWSAIVLHDRAALSRCLRALRLQPEDVHLFAVLC